MDPRFLQGRGTQVYTGTELLLKGALEGEVSLLTGYPGSPIADFFNLARNIKDEAKHVPTITNPDQSLQDSDKLENPVADELALSEGGVEIENEPNAITISDIEGVS